MRKTRYQLYSYLCRVTVRDGSSLPVQTETLIFWFRFTPRSTSVLTRVGFTDAAFRVLDILFKVNVMLLPFYSNSTLCRLLLSLCVIAMWLIVGNIWSMFYVYFQNLWFLHR